MVTLTPPCKVRKSLCGCSLRSATLLIAWSLLFSQIGTAIPSLIAGTKGLFKNPDPDTKPEHDVAHRVVTFILGLLDITGVFACIAGLMGVYQEVKSLVSFFLVWLALNSFAYVVTFIIGLFVFKLDTLLSYIYTDPPLDTKVTGWRFYGFVGALIYIAWRLYLWILVGSFYYYKYESYGLDADAGSSPGAPSPFGNKKLSPYTTGKSPNGNKKSPCVTRIPSPSRRRKSELGNPISE